MPMRTSLAWTKGCWLKAGSSAMLSWSATSEPVKSEKLRCPRVTCRPGGIGKHSLNTGPVVVCIQEEGNGDEQDEDEAARYRRNGDPQTTPVHHRKILFLAQGGLVRFGSSERTMHPARNIPMVLGQARHTRSALGCRPAEGP